MSANLALRRMGTVLLLLLAAVQARGGEWDALRVRTAGAYAFAEKPAVTRAGDRITIAFAVKEACDVTVAIEEPNGRIVRFLASGVLGDNAPAPFAKGALKQELVWDGKDEQGRYIDGKEALTVRVSLGLKARYERTLWWSPKKRTSESGELKLAATAGGLYVWDKDSLRLFDHAGEYAKTLYPFPSGSLAGVKGLAVRAFPPEGEFPLKFGTAQDTLLALSRPPGDEGWPGKGGGATATAVAARGDTLVLVNTRVNTIAPNGADLTGPEVTFPVNIGTVHDFKGGTYPIAPKSAALSPDGQWLYLTGYLWHNPWRQGALNGVVRVAMKEGAKPECFIGSMAQGKGGAGDTEFNTPSSVACDAQGRVYVTDYKNNRLQIFSPDGKLAKSVKIDGAALVRVDPKNGEIFVFSWTLQYSYSSELEWKGNPVLRRLASFDDPKVTATYPVEMPAGWNAPPAAEVDFWAEPLSVWLAPAAPGGGKGVAWWTQSNLRQYVLKSGKLELKQDFSKESDKALVRARPARHERQRLFFNPARGMLYIGDHHQPAQIHAKGFSDLTEINPETGKIAICPLPFDAEDMAFDFNGLAYLRTVDRIARYDGRTWREVPFDYGEEWEQMTSQGFKTAKTMSTLAAAGAENSSLQYGGMAVSPLGHMLVTFYLPGANADRRGSKTVAGETVERYRPTVFPGRSMECVQHVWDKHGKLIHADVVPGFRRTASVGIDRDDALYLMTDGLLTDGGKPYPNPGSCTLVKVLPTKAKVLTSGGNLPVPLGPETQPKRPPDLTGCLGPDAWVEGAEWMFAGVGIDAKRQHCHCTGTSQIALDYFKRTFAPEIQRYGVVAVDANGNPLLRIGRYGNIDEGKPLVPAGSPEAKDLGGDETALFNPRFLATETDRRLFVADPGNNRVLSVKLDYHATERVALKDVPDAGQ